jgi:zinc protease
VARELFAKLLFGAHPYARPMFGTEESLRSLTPEDAEAHWRRLLDPRNLVVAIAGDVDFDEAAAQVEGLFGKLKPRKFSPIELVAPPPPAGIESASESRRKEQTHIVAGFLGCPLGSPDEEALHLLNAALTGQGGRLFLELRDKRHLAYNVYSFYREGVERGAFGVYLATKPDRADEAVEAMLAAVRRAVDRPPKGNELARAKRHLIGSQQLDLQTVGAVALTTGLNELLGLGHRYHLGSADRIRKISAAQIAKVAKKHLTLDRMVIAKVGDFERNGA